MLYTLYTCTSTLDNDRESLRVIVRFSLRWGCLESSKASVNPCRKTATRNQSPLASLIGLWWSPNGSRVNDQRRGEDGLVGSLHPFAQFPPGKLLPLWPGQSSSTASGTGGLSRRETVSLTAIVDARASPVSFASTLGVIFLPLGGKSPQSCSDGILIRQIQLLGVLFIQRKLYLISGDNPDGFPSVSSLHHLPTAGVQSIGRGNYCVLEV